MSGLKALVRRNTLSSAASWLALAYALAIAGFLLWNAFPESDGAMLLMAILVIIWMVSPVAIAAGLASASSTGLGAGLFLALELALILSIVLLIVDINYIQRSSTGGIAILIWPLFQLLAIIPTFLVALACSWRLQPDFPKEEPALLTLPPRA